MKWRAVVDWGRDDGVWLCMKGSTQSSSSINAFRKDSCVREEFKCYCIFQQ